MNEERGNKLCSELTDTKRSNGCIFVKTNVTEEDSVKAAIKATKDKFSAIHGAINCAGVGIGVKTATPSRGAHPLATFKQVIDINLVGTFNVCRLAADEMLKQPREGGEGHNNLVERGVLINTSSVAAFEGQIGQVAYSSSKAGLIGMTFVMARDLAQFGVRSVAIAPVRLLTMNGD